MDTHNFKFSEVLWVYLHIALHIYGGTMHMQLHSELDPPPPPPPLLLGYVDAGKSTLMCV